MKKVKVKRLMKAEATRFYKSLIGTGAGVWEVTKNAEYAIRQGQIVYSVELVDHWPFGWKLQLTAFIGDMKIIEQVLFDRDSHLPWDEASDRQKASEQVGRVIEKLNKNSEG